MQNYNSELILENDRNEKSKMRVFPNGRSYDLVSFIFSYNEKSLSMSDEPFIDGEGRECFDLDKFNVGCLIDYLKRIYDAMEDE